MTFYIMYCFKLFYNHFCMVIVQSCSFLPSNLIPPVQREIPGDALFILHEKITWLLHNLIGSYIHAWRMFSVKQFYFLSSNSCWKCSVFPQSWKSHIQIQETWRPYRKQISFFVVWATAMSCWKHMQLLIFKNKHTVLSNVLWLDPSPQSANSWVITEMNSALFVSGSFSADCLCSHVTHACWLPTG